MIVEIIYVLSCWTVLALFNIGATSSLNGYDYYGFKYRDDDELSIFDSIIDLPVIFIVTFLFWCKGDLNGQ